jgi:hypothetical protein
VKHERTAPLKSTLRSSGQEGAAPELSSHVAFARTKSRVGIITYQNCCIALPSQTHYLFAEGGRIAHQGGPYPSPVFVQVFILQELHARFAQA